MLVDGHMNTKFLKQWVNGAAFHTQMLIHQARLEGSDGSRAVQAAGVYHRQLSLLLEKYKSYLEDVTDVYSAHDYSRTLCCLDLRENQVYHLPVKCFRMKEDYCFDRNEVVATMFTKDQISWAPTYFSDLQAKVPALVRENDSFHV